MMYAPITVLVLLLALVVTVLECERRQSLAWLFNVLPAPIVIYILSIASGGIGLLPHASPVYDSINEYGVPFAIFLLTIGTDLKALTGIGPKALIMALTCIVGTFSGLALAFLFLSRAGDQLAWQPVTLLGASWIGGSGNMIAIQRAMEMLPSAIGPMVVADAVVGSCWIAALMALAPHQARLDRVLRAARPFPAGARAPSVKTLPDTDAKSLCTIIFLALAATSLAEMLGIFLATDVGLLGAGSWALMIITTTALALSFTRAGVVGRGIGNSISQLVIYVVLATIGAKADFGFITRAPLFIGAAAIALMVHIALGLTVARALHIPFRIFAASSAAGIGGVASAPIIVRPYGREMAPLALIIALGYYSITNYLCLAFGMTLRAVQ